jgi:hypothetical protein
MVQIPNRPFAASELDRLGLPKHEVRRLVDAGLLRRPLRGAYCPADLPDTTEVRARCAALVLPEHSVVCDRSAAWLHGVDVLDPAEVARVPDLEVVARRGHTRARRAGLYGGERELLPEDICEVAGVRLTTPLRTACDLACLRGRYSALAVLDSFARLHGVTRRDVERLLPRYRRRRGVVQLRQLTPLMNGARESTGESFCAAAIERAGLPLPTPQVWVDLAGFGRVRLDHAYEELKIAIEYDGEEFHTTRADRERDLRRRAALEREGWLVIVVGKHDFAEPALGEWIARLRRALDDRGRPFRRTYPVGRPLERPRRPALRS